MFTCSSTLVNLPRAKKTHASAVWIQPLLQASFAAPFCRCFPEGGELYFFFFDSRMFSYFSTSGSHQLSVPRVRRSTFGTRAFSVAGPTVWNSLPDHLRDPADETEQFRRDLKT